jgi:hypothetical protein
MYPNCDTGAKNFKDTSVNSTTNKIKILLKDILKLIVNLSNLEKKRYTYASASLTKDRCCGVCGKQFIKNNKKCVPYFAIRYYTN